MKFKRKGQAATVTCCTYRPRVRLRSAAGTLGHTFATYRPRALHPRIAAWGNRIAWRVRLLGGYASHPEGIGTLVGQRYDKIIVAG